MSGYAHIIAIYILLVFLFAVLAVILVRTKEEKLRKEKDYLQVVAEKKAYMLERSGISLSVEKYFCLVLICGFLGGVTGFFFSGNGFLAVILGGIGMFLPNLIIRILVQNRKKKFNENYAKALEQLASSLKAGLSIQLAVKDVVASPFIDETLRKQFAHISSDLQMGRTVQEAFKSFAEEVNNPYADDVALSIDIQNETGGHEADVIKDIADGIRERIMLQREIRSIFNETVLTIRVIQLIAPVSMVGMLLLLPSYRSLYLGGGFFTAVLLILTGMELAGVIIDNTMVSKAKKGK